MRVTMSATALASIALASCTLAAAAHAQAGLPPGAVVQMAGRSTGLNTMTYDRIEPANVWRAVESLYKAAQIEPTTVDRAAYRMVYLASPAPKSIAKVRLKDAFDCGGDKKSPLAESVPLEVMIRSEVNPVGAGGSEVKTAVTAIPLQKDATGELPSCRSKGRIEQKLQPKIKTATVVRRVG